MEKVTLKLSGKIYNLYSETEPYCSLYGMTLTGTLVQVGLAFEALSEVSGGPDIVGTDENIEVYKKCLNAIGKDEGI